MLGMCDLGYGVDPCLMCIFPSTQDGLSGVELLAEQLGLSPELLADGEAVLEYHHLEGLSREQQVVLEPHVGKPVCGLAHAVGLTHLAPDGYMPSVPFVSLQAACLSVGRLIAHRMKLAIDSNFIQYDGLIGPHRATAERMKRRPDCLCSVRARNIEKIRKLRSERGIRS